MDKRLRNKQVEKFLLIRIIFSNNYYYYMTTNSSTTTTAAAAITGGESILVESFSWEIYLLYIKEKIHELN